jgi:hypothetical protein
MICAAKQYRERFGIFDRKGSKTDSVLFASQRKFVLEFTIQLEQLLNLVECHSVTVVNGDSIVVAIVTIVTIVTTVVTTVVTAAVTTVHHHSRHSRDWKKTTQSFQVLCLTNSKIRKSPKIIEIDRKCIRVAEEFFFLRYLVAFQRNWHFSIW